MVHSFRPMCPGTAAIEAVETVQRSTVKYMEELEAELSFMSVIKNRRM